MSAPSKHAGVVVPMATPFTHEGLIDEPAAERMVDRLARHDLGVFVLGTTGETSSLNSAQRERLVTVATRTAAGRVPVYTGIGDNCVNDSLDAARLFFRLGADAVVAHLPSYYLLNDAEILAYFENLVRQIHGPVLVYNIPQTTRMSIPVDIAEQLAEHTNIVGFKDSENVPGRPEELARRLAGRPDFSLFMGVAVLSAKALRLGFDGLVPSSGNLAPALWQQLYAEAKAGRWENVDTLQLKLDAVAQVFQRNRSLAQSLAALKAAIESQGLCTSAVLPPLLPLGPVDRDAISRELASLALV